MQATNPGFLTFHLVYKTGAGQRKRTKRRSNSNNDKEMV